MCISANAGLVINKHTVGLNYYSGLLPMSGGGSDYGFFVRSFPWENSFFITTRLGWMKSTWGHPQFKSDSGPAAGIDIGNQWFYDSGFSQGVTWVGLDFYLKSTEVGELPHGLRYEIGWRF